VLIFVIFCKSSAASKFTADISCSVFAVALLRYNSVAYLCSSFTANSARPSAAMILSNSDSSMATTHCCDLGQFPPSPTRGAVHHECAARIGWSRPGPLATTHNAAARHDRFPRYHESAWLLPGRLWLFTNQWDLSHAYAIASPPCNHPQPRYGTLCRPSAFSYVFASQRDAPAAQDSGETTPV